jgi:hypothetical protein
MSSDVATLIIGWGAVLSLMLVAGGTWWYLAGVSFRGVWAADAEWCLVSGVHCGREQSGIRAVATRGKGQ